MLEAWQDGFADGLSGKPRQPARPGSACTQYNLAWYAGLNERRAREERQAEAEPSARDALEQRAARLAAIDAAEKRRARG